MTLCVCDAIHILVSHLQLQRQGMEVKAARRRALEINMQPVFLTSLTTAIGFYVFVPTDYRGVAELGLIAGTGMFVINPPWGLEEEAAGLDRLVRRATRRR